MLKKEAYEIVGGLSRTSKMPGRSYGLPAKECKTGAKLATIPGTVCSDCYALKGCYVFRVVQDAQYRRLASLSDPRWVDAMVTAIGTDKWFRWHDSGDLQSVDHLRKIVQVCERTPNTRHWLPTRENAIVTAFIWAGGKLPTNLVVRVSAHRVDQSRPLLNAFLGQRQLGTSTVHKETEPQGYSCPAYKQGGECGDCRACWNPEVSNISYPKH